MKREEVKTGRHCKVSAGFWSGDIVAHKKYEPQIKRNSHALALIRKKLVASRSVVSAFISEQRRHSVTFCGEERQAVRRSRILRRKMRRGTRPRRDVGSVDKKDTFVNLLLFLLDTCLSPLTAPLWHKRPTLEWKYACIHRVSPVKRYPIP